MLWIPHTSSSKCNMKLIQQPGEEKLQISKQKALSLNATNFFCMKIFFIENRSCFFFFSKQGLNLISRSTCFFVLKSYFVLNSRIAKPEWPCQKCVLQSLVFPKVYLLLTTPSQSALNIILGT